MHRWLARIWGCYTTTATGRPLATRTMIATLTCRTPSVALSSSASQKSARVFLCDWMACEMFVASLSANSEKRDANVRECYADTGIYSTCISADFHSFFLTCSPLHSTPNSPLLTGAPIASLFLFIICMCIVLSDYLFISRFFLILSEAHQIFRVFYSLNIRVFSCSCVLFLP